MLKAKHYGNDGKAKGEVDLPEALFGAEPKPSVVWQAVRAFLAAQRQGTASTKTRSNVRGGGRKPWRQKGTGRARAGSIRANQWRGGYTAFGPLPRSYNQRLPKKVRRQALVSVLSDRAQNGKVAVVDDWQMEAPKTRTVASALDAMGLGSQKVCVVTAGSQPNVFKSFRNLPRVMVLPHSALNVYDLANADTVVITHDALGGMTEVFK